MGDDGARPHTADPNGRPDVTAPHEPQQPPGPMVVPTFFIRQRITLMVNRYEVVGMNPDGSEGTLLAFAEQKRMKLKEEVVFYADTSKSRPVFRFKARQRLDVAAEHDVFDEYGNPLGYFRKEFGASLLRSTWTLSTPTLNAVGRERADVGPEDQPGDEQPGHPGHHHHPPVPGRLPQQHRSGVPQSCASSAVHGVLRRSCAACGHAAAGGRGKPPARGRTRPRAYVPVPDLRRGRWVRSGTGRW